MTTAPPQATIANEVTVSISTVNGTGKISRSSVSIDNVLNLFSESAIIKDGDLESLSASLTFAAGSSDGAEMCAHVTALSEQKVENEENITVTLDLVTSGDSLTVGNNVTNI